MSEALLQLSEQIADWWQKERAGRNTEAMLLNLAWYRQHMRFGEFVEQAQLPLQGSAVLPLRWAPPQGWFITVSRRWEAVLDETGTVNLGLSPPFGILGREVEPPPSDLVVDFAVQFSAPLLDRKAWRWRRGELAASLRDLLAKFGPVRIPLDKDSTREEIAFHVFFGALRRRVLPPAEGESVVAALANAFPRAVGRVRYSLGGATREEAAAELLGQVFERLIPERGPAAVRGYVRKIAEADWAIREARPFEARVRFSGRSREESDRDSADEATADDAASDEIVSNMTFSSEASYYRLRRKLNVRGRAKIDDEVLARMGAILAERDKSAQESARRQNALNLLQSNGFSKAAARKWVQRHGVAAVATARPRKPRPQG